MVSPCILLSISTRIRQGIYANQALLSPSVYSAACSHSLLYFTMTVVQFPSQVKPKPSPVNALIS